MHLPSERVLPDCWGHRGASAAFPENTLASFEAAIRDGAEGIESADVHVSSDDVVIMFHDPDLSRTTNSTGAIKDRTWYGENGMEHVRTVKEPRQAIPTFAETITLLMKASFFSYRSGELICYILSLPLSRHPNPFIAREPTSQPDWETKLASRLVLGLWHPSFIVAAKETLPYLTRSFIGSSPSVARTYFWNHCDFFSMSFAVLATSDGEKFRKECQDAGKKLMVWTVNKPEHMMEAVRWGVDCILTDVTRTWLDMRSALYADYEKTGLQYSRIFLWTTLDYWTPIQMLRQTAEVKRLQSIAGPFRIEAPVTISTAA
ncbi:PLC-like phosphodiesterase [Lentinula edodes]|nr:PLC-like phosphodiesterase [Lentinula edodes]